MKRKLYIRSQVLNFLSHHMICKWDSFVSMTVQVTLGSIAKIKLIQWSSLVSSRMQVASTSFKHLAVNLVFASLQVVILYKSNASGQVLFIIAN